MLAAILGKKIGMTQVYDAKGVVHPVTVVQAGPCSVLQVKTAKSDGYEAVQLGFEDVKPRRATAPQIGHAGKASSRPKRFIREIRLMQATDLAQGAIVTVEAFDGVSAVDVIGTSKGKGFQGGMKRYGFGGHPASHGASKDHRAPGSIGANTDPGHVWKGTRMAGQMGNKRHTVKNLRIVKIDSEKNLLMLKGAVPGAVGSYVIVRSCAPRKGKQQ